MAVNSALSGAGDLSEILDQLVVFSAPLQLRHDVKAVRRLLASNVFVHRPVTELLRAEFVGLLRKMEIGHQRGGVEQIELGNLTRLAGSPPELKAAPVRVVAE